MKKAILLFVLPLTICISAKSQGYKGASDGSYKVGDNIVSLGVGVGSTMGYYGGSTQSPAISAQYERGIWEVGPGVISLGGYLGYKSYKYSGVDAGTSYSYKWNYTIFGARGAYHFTNINVENLDVYAGAMISYDAVSFSYHDGAGGSYGGNGGYGSNVEVSPFGGARYYFANGLGAYGEVGFGVSVLNIGLCYHF